MHRVHDLIIVNMSAKFDENLHYGLVSVMFTRSKSDTPIDITTAALLYPLHNALLRDHKVIDIFNRNYTLLHIPLHVHV